ncbi:Ig-like domain-containing protein [Oceanobacillus senegalensis]|uniref:Ig-like domain-containing protein n=1 Tax=Oceanobacillus senegalensis TaxID=1936063 RepID=UPI000A310855|nr:Ig-like domain-containing protein [Oceanobacillus senegalensis]
MTCVFIIKKGRWFMVVVITVLSLFSMPTMTNANLLDLSLLKEQHVDVRYDAEEGKLVLDIYGDVVLDVSLGTTQYIYLLPPELAFIVDHPDAIAMTIEKKLLGLIGSPKPVDSITIDKPNRVIIGKDAFDMTDLITGISSLRAKLIIDLKRLDVHSLPPSDDGVLEFYGFAAKEGLINLKLLERKDYKATIETSLPDTTPPEAPIVHQVTDQDTVITGTGEANTSVRIQTPIGVYNGRLDQEGNFRVDIPLHRAGMEIIVTLTDKEGNESEPTTTSVIGTILEFIVPSHIQFPETIIPPYEVTIPTEDPNWAITVRDTRGQGSTWQIKARATAPLSTIDGDTLSREALLFSKNNKVFPMINGVIIHEGETGIEEQTVIQWEENEGIQLKLNPFEAQANKEYSTTIEWTLEDAP